MATNAWIELPLQDNLGTVTSIGIADGSTVPLFGITGSPVTTSGTITLTLQNQSANTILSGPTTGAAAQPTFRALVAADLPAMSYTIYLIAAGANNGFAANGLDLSGTNSPSATAYGTAPQSFGGLDFTVGSPTATQGLTHFRLPSDWTGNIDIVLFWFSGSTSTNSVVWTVATAFVADAVGLLAPTYNTTQNIIKANNAVANTRNSAALANITQTGAAAGSTMFLKIGRNPTNGSDTLAATATLLGIELTYRRKQ